jgi:hypothetical protein
MRYFRYRPVLNVGRTERNRNKQYKGVQSRGKPFFFFLFLYIFYMSFGRV